MTVVISDPVSQIYRLDEKVAQRTTVLRSPSSPREELSKARRPSQLNVTEALEYVQEGRAFVVGYGLAITICLLDQTVLKGRSLTLIHLLLYIFSVNMLLN